MPAHDATVPQKASGNHVPVSAASTNSARVLNSLRRYQMLRTPGDGEVRLWPKADVVKILRNERLLLAPLRLPLSRLGQRSGVSLAEQDQLSTKCE